MQIAFVTTRDLLVLLGLGFPPISFLLTLFPNKDNLGEGRRESPDVCSAQALSHAAQELEKQQKKKKSIHLGAKHELKLPKKG